MKYLLLCVVILLSCNGYNNTDRDVSGGYDKICIEGHVYYKRSLLYQGYLAIKLDDNGKPIKCMESTVWKKRK